MINEQIVFNGKDFPIRVVGDFQTHNKKSYVGKIYPMHFHDEYEFLYVKSGCLRCVTDNNEYRAYPGDMIFINSHIPHETYSDKIGTDTILVQFRPQIMLHGPLRYLCKFMKTENIQCYIFKKNSEYSNRLKNCITDMTNESTKKQSSYKYFMSATMYMMNAILLRTGVILDETEIINKNNIKRLLPVIEYVNQHYSQQLTLKEVSNLMHINSSYFCRLFKQSTGSNFTEYLSFVRICKAKDLLNSGSNISEAAYNVGFSSLSYFNRVFKKYTFCSPKDYKKFYKQHYELEF